MLGQHIEARAKRLTSPQVGWLPWTVHDRAKGFHVSRESAGGTKVETLTNSVGKTTIFRKRELAVAACEKANKAAA